MNIKLYKNNSENEKIGKSLVELGTLSGNIREGTSIINPVITTSNSVIEHLQNLNYIYIPDFNRYYFVTDVSTIRNGIWVLSCRVDVLESFKSEILSQKAVISRQEKKWNLYLDDGIFKTYQNPHIICKRFPQGFTGQSFVLAVAGG